MKTKTLEDVKHERTIKIVEVLQSEYGFTENFAKYFWENSNTKKIYDEAEKVAKTSTDDMEVYVRSHIAHAPFSEAYRDLKSEITGEDI